MAVFIGTVRRRSALHVMPLSSLPKTAPPPAVKSRTHMVGKCGIYKEERDALEMRKIDECDTKKFGTLDSSENTIAILGD